jgi:hypothetical protein
VLTCCTVCGNTLPDYHEQLTSFLDFCSETCLDQASVTQEQRRQWHALQARHRKQLTPVRADPVGTTVREAAGAAPPVADTKSGSSKRRY